MTRKTDGIGRVPQQSNAGPETRYNDIPGGASAPSSNLGARPARGQIRPNQSYRKLDDAVPLSSVIGLTEALDSKQSTDERGQISGYAPLDNAGNVPLGNLPLPLNQSNTHGSPDTDVGASSLHHTLGSGATQAAAGNHTHTITMSLPAFFVDGALSVGSVPSRLPIDDTYTIVGVRLTAATAPTGADLIIDVNKNGSTIFTTTANRPRIVATANAGGPGVTPDIANLVAGDYLTIDVDQVGSGTAGSNLVICVVVTKTL